ncbi:MAG: DinB family protein [Pyrinomonadaceae bacterium]|nr:DinB family protein [Pyrinomonadaceae bacterium]
MKRSNVLALTLLILCGTVMTHAQSVATTKTATAPTSGFRAEVLRQIEDAEKKLIALAEAVPQEKYSWRPAEGVRSTSEVFMHVAGGNFFIPQAIGAKPPASFNRDMEKITDKVKVVESLKQSFEHIRQAVLNTSDADLDKSVKLFGRDTTTRDVLLLLATHSHEHLGQAIAYARMSNVVPPWTAARPAQPQRPSR